MATTQHFTTLLFILLAAPLALTAQYSDEAKIWRSSIGLTYTTVGATGVDTRQGAVGARMVTSTVIPVDEVRIILASGFMGAYSPASDDGFGTRYLIFRPHIGAGAGYRVEVSNDWTLVPRLLAGVDGTAFGAGSDDLGETSFTGGLNMFLAPGVGIGNGTITASLSYRATIAGISSFSGNQDVYGTSDTSFPGNTLTATVGFRRVQLSIATWAFGPDFDDALLDGLSSRITGFTLGANLALGK